MSRKSNSDKGIEKHGPKLTTEPVANLNHLALRHVVQVANVQTRGAGQLQAVDDKLKLVISGVVGERFLGPQEPANALHRLRSPAAVNGVDGLKVSVLLLSLHMLMPCQPRRITK